jgi:hypothetical protein
MSAIASLSWWRFHFRFFDGAIKSAQLIEYLGALKRQIGKPLLIELHVLGANLTFNGIRQNG